MIYSVVNNDYADRFQVQADSVHCTGHAEDGSFTAQFNRRVPNPQYVPPVGTTFGVDPEEGEQDDPMDDSQWERRQRTITVVTAIYSGCREVTLVE